VEFTSACVRNREYVLRDDDGGGRNFSCNAAHREHYLLIANSMVCASPHYEGVAQSAMLERAQQHDESWNGSLRVFFSPASSPEIFLFCIFSLSLSLSFTLGRSYPLLFTLLILRAVLLPQRSLVVGLSLFFPLRVLVAHASVRSFIRSLTLSFFH